MARVYNLGQAEVDDMEMWVVATLLNPDGEEAGDPLQDRMMTPAEFEAEARRILKQRVSAAERQQPSSIPSVNEGPPETTA